MKFSSISKFFLNFLFFKLQNRISAVTLNFPEQTEFEYYSSYMHMQTLQFLEYNVLEKFSKTLNDHENKINSLKAFIQEIENEEKTSPDLENPISQYKLIARMAKDWPKILKNTVNLDKHLMKDFNESIEGYGKPTISDIEGTAESLIRLHEIYDIYPKEFEVNNHTFTAQDCFDIGRQAYLNSDSYQTVIWMRESWKRYLKGDKIKSNLEKISEFEILDHLSHSLAYLGYNKFAVRIMKIMIQIVHDKKEEIDRDTIDRIIANYEYFKQEVENRNDIETPINSDIMDFKFPKPNSGKNEHFFENYEDLCNQKDFYETIPQSN